MRLFIRRLWHRLFGHSPVYSWTWAHPTGPLDGWWRSGCQGCGNPRIRRDYYLARTR